MATEISKYFVYGNGAAFTNTVINNFTKFTKRLQGMYASKETKLLVYLNEFINRLSKKIIIIIKMNNQMNIVTIKYF